jgi:hypothetical protein
MEEYEQKVELYFQAEYSDFSIGQTIEKIVEAKDFHSKKWWENKIKKLMRVYYQTNKHQSDAARHIANLFKPALESLLKY